MNRARVHRSSLPPRSADKGPNLWIHLSSPSRRAAGPGKRHPARGTPRAQPRDVRSGSRDTWNLTGEALGGPRKRSWRWCSRARSGRRSAIRGAHSGALDRPEPSDPAARAPIRTSAPYSAAGASGSSSAAGARRQPKGSRRAVGAPRARVHAQHDAAGSGRAVRRPRPCSRRRSTRARWAIDNCAAGCVIPALGEASRSRRPAVPGGALPATLGRGWFLEFGYARWSARNAPACAPFA